MYVCCYVLNRRSFLGIWTVKQYKSHIVRVYDAGHGESSVYHSAEWHDGDWSNYGIREACFIWVENVLSFLSLIYADKPQTLDHLEDNIRRIIADIRPQMLEKVIENWTSRLDYIRASRGSPMPEIIFKMAAADREDRLIVISAVTAPDSLLSTVRRATRTRVFTMTIHRWLIERNLRLYRPLRHVPLTPAHCRARLLWCLARSAQRYVNDIQRTVLLPFLLKYPSLIFQQDNARPYAARVAMNCLTACQTLSWSAISLSNRACLGYNEKTTASTKEC
ncbi:HTH_Tnp_Tc3_2 domain-containing protein [Trichonephila clavipes]|nr:HTH_Tnp_Tc3_2 domain-containing protein [Trichonephila clavipes]